MIPLYIVEKLKNLNIEDVAKQLGMSVFRHKALCFMHEDRHPSLSFMKNGHGWKCFVCDKGGANAISLVMEYKGVDFKEACDWLCREYSIYYDGQTRIHPKRTMPAFERTFSRKDSNAPAGNNEKYYEIIDWIVTHAGLSECSKTFLFCQRKLTPSVINQLQIGSVSEPEKLIQALTSEFEVNDLIDSEIIKETNTKYYLRAFTPCILFPYCDIEGNIVGLQTRYIGNNPKAPRFQYLGYKSINIFNLPILRTLKALDDLYISEGITDCLAMLSDGLKAIAIPSASNIPENDLRLLAKFRLHMYADHDEAGERAFREMRKKLIDFGGYIKREDFPRQYKDYGEYYQHLKNG